MKRLIEVQVKGRPAERHELANALAWAGANGSESLVPHGTSISVPVQLTFSPLQEGVRVEVPGESAKWFVCEGSQVKRMVVRWETEIYLGDARFAFFEDAASARSKGVFSFLVGLLLIVLGALAFRLLTPESVARRDVEAPVLGPASGKCRETAPKARAARAHALERAAAAKKERSPFDGSDGVDALFLLGEARACFAGAGRIDDEARTDEALRDWTVRMNDDYASLRLRLRVALDQGFVADALRAAKGLETLLSRQRESAYAEWLRAVRRELERKAARTAS